MNLVALMQFTMDVAADATGITPLWRLAISHSKRSGGPAEVGDDAMAAGSRAFLDAVRAVAAVIVAWLDLHRFNLSRLFLNLSNLSILIHVII